MVQVGQTGRNAALKKRSLLPHTLCLNSSQYVSLQVLLVSEAIQQRTGAHTTDSHVARLTEKDKMMDIILCGSCHSIPNQAHEGPILCKCCLSDFPEQSITGEASWAETVHNFRALPSVPRDDFLEV